MSKMMIELILTLMIYFSVILFLVVILRIMFEDSTASPDSENIYLKEVEKLRKMKEEDEEYYNSYIEANIEYYRKILDIPIEFNFSR